MQTIAPVHPGLSTSLSKPVKSQTTNRLHSINAPIDAPENNFNVAVNEPGDHYPSKSKIRVTGEKVTLSVHKTSLDATL